MGLSGLLEICERESVKKIQWRRLNAVSHVGWSFLLLGSEERECVLCHVRCLVLLLAIWEARRERQNRSVLLERPAWKRVKECYLAFFQLPGEVTRAEWHEIFSLVKNMSSGQNSQNIPAPDNNLKFSLLQFLSLRSQGTCSLIVDFFASGLVWFWSIFLEIMKCAFFFIFTDKAFLEKDFFFFYLRSLKIHQCKKSQTTLKRAKKDRSQ